jgi:hypothetical protein
VWRCVNLFQEQVQTQKSTTNLKLEIKNSLQSQFSVAKESLKKNQGQEQVQEQLFSLRSKVDLLCRRFLLRRKDKIKNKDNIEFKNQLQIINFELET